MGLCEAVYSTVEDTGERTTEVKQWITIRSELSSVALRDKSRMIRENNQENLIIELAAIRQSFRATHSGPQR